MFEHERPLDEELQPFEEEVYTDLMESWDIFVTEREELFTSLRQAMDGTSGDTLGDAIAAVHLEKQSYIECLEDLTETIFDTVEHDEAVEVWARLIDEDLKARLKAIRAINVQASFSLTPLSELRINAEAYATGREKARADGVLDRAVSSPADSVQSAMIGIERLHEILENDDIEWGNLSEVSEGDEYAEWVLDEICEDLDDHIDGLLELCPPDLYEQ